MEAKNIFLVGPMGVGKTTIGRQLAKALTMRFVDSDHEIEERTGADIPWIFDIEGEQGFRDRESAVIEELTKLNGIILATGGGAVLDERNRTHLMNNGVVVYLRASLEKLLQRTNKDRNRPLLQTENPKQKIQEILTQRDPLYCMVADIIIDTERRNVSNSVKLILIEIKKLSES